MLIGYSRTFNLEYTFPGEHFYLEYKFPGEHFYLEYIFSGEHFYLEYIFPGEHFYLEYIFPGEHFYLEYNFPGEHFYLEYIFPGEHFPWILWGILELIVLIKSFLHTWSVQQVLQFTPSSLKKKIWVTACDFQQWGILTSVNSD